MGQNFDDYPGFQPKSTAATQCIRSVSKKRLHIQGFFETDVIKVLYMSSSFGLLGFESRDFSQAEKGRTACKAEQIHKMTTIFTENNDSFQTRHFD